MLNLQWTDRRAVDVGIIFTLAVCIGIVLLGGWLAQYELEAPPPNATGFFYEWQRADPTFWSRASVWILFGLHQLAIWVTIWWAKEKYKTYSDKLRPANYWALGINGYSSSCTIYRRCSSMMASRRIFQAGPRSTP